MTGVNLDDGETQVEESKPEGTQENDDYNMDEYDIEDYYDDEYGYGRYLERA